jgi:hypothetical protein
MFNYYTSSPNSLWTRLSFLPKSVYFLSCVIVPLEVGTLCERNVVFGVKSELGTMQEI